MTNEKIIMNDDSFEINADEKDIIISSKDI